MNPSRHTPEGEWEAWLDRRLKELPDCPAPASLAPRVLAAVAARAQRPWYRQPWFTWPRLAQAASLLLLSGTLGSLTYALIHWSALAGGAAGTAPWQVWWAPVEALGMAMASVLEAGGVVARQVDSRVWVALGTLAALMYLTCVGVGTVMYRLLARPHREGRPHERV